MPYTTTTTTGVDHTAPIVCHCVHRGMHRHVINGIIPVARQSRNFKNLTVLVPKEQKRFMRMEYCLEEEEKEKKVLGEGNGRGGMSRRRRGGLGGILEGWLRRWFC